MELITFDLLFDYFSKFLTEVFNYSITFKHLNQAWLTLQ